MSMAPDKIFQELAAKTSQRKLELKPAYDVIKWLNDQGKELRILVDRANGLGHHTTTLNLMRRMIALGFNQTIRIFYDPMDATKLQLLIPGFSAVDGQLQPNMTFNGVTLAFSFYGGKPPKDKAPLLICGGSESQDRSARLKEFNVDYYLQLQPYAWGKSSSSDNYILSNNKMIGLDGQRFLTVGGIFYNHGFYQTLPSYNPDNWSTYAMVPRFAESMKMAEILRISKDKVWFAPAYGLKTRTDLPTSLFNYSAALLKLQDLIRNLPETDREIRRPFVVVSFDDLTTYWDDLASRFNGTIESMPTNLRRYLEEKALFSRIVLYRGNSDNLEKAISALKENQVMMVSMPNTPSDVFNWLYAQTNVAPGIFEGRGTLNLAFNMGLPYFCMDAEKAYPNTDSFTVEQSTIGGAIRAHGIDNLNASMSAYDLVSPDKFPFTVLAQTMLDMNYPPYVSQNPTLNYFRQLAKLFHDQRNDKLVLGLIAFGKMIKVVKQLKSSSPATEGEAEGGENA